MDNKNFETENSMEVMIRREEKSGAFRKYLKTAVTAILMAAILITAGIFVINKKAGVESKQSSFKLTTFDYVINSPTKEQVTEFSSNPAVEKIFPCYLFEISANGGFRFPLLMCDSLDGYEVSLFNEDTCISGKADASGIMLDKTAAEKMQLKVGDSVSFAMGGRTVSLKVSGIYMASTYNGLNKGLGLAVFTEEMKSYFKNEITYKKAFIDAKDVSACGEMLKGYIPYGDLISEAAYIENEKKNKPSDVEYSAWEATAKADYLTLKEKFEKGSHTAAVEIKSAFMQDVLDQVETRDSDVTYISVILGIASFIAYAALGILFIYMNKRDDEISLREGVPHSKMFKEYMYTNAFGALFVALVTGAALLAVAAMKHHLAACLPIVLLSALPVLPAALIAIIFAKGYLNRLYSVNINRAENF